MKTRVAWLWLLLSLAAPRLWADVWDQGSGNDNGTGTQNELVNGALQLHDLAALPGPAADQDWYRLGQPPYSSWEILVDSLSVAVPNGTNLSLQRIGSDGTTVLQSSASISSLGLSRSLRWANTTNTEVPNQFLRVMSTTCTTNCDPSDTYQVRAYETTYAIPRFNNTGYQVTSLVIQNKSAATVNGTIYFWDAVAVLLKAYPFGVAAKNTFVLGLPGVPELVDKAGSITIVNDGRLHDLSGKATAIDTFSGYSFDTLMEPRAR